MGNEDITIDPWGSAQSTDYDRIIDQFGLTPLNPSTISEPSRLHRRGIISLIETLMLSKNLSEKGIPLVC